MELSALTRTLAKDGPKPVYLVQGTESLLVDEAVDAILRAAVGDPNDAMSVTRVDLASGKTAARDIVAACRAIGLFVSRIAVVVRASELLDKKTSERDELARYVNEPVTAATLILKATPKLNGTSALFKRVKKHGAVLTYNEIKGRQAIRWVMDAAKGHGHSTDYGAAQLVTELVGTNLLQLRNTLNQLSLYVGPGKPITQRAVENCLAATRSHSVFELVDAVGNRDAAGALRHLGSMLQHREKPLRILAMLVRHFRFLWQLGELRARRTSLDDATNQLKIHPFQAKKMWSQSQKFNARTLREAYERLFETDLALKSSRLDGGLIMERLVLDLCR